jgi:hypothetical protein
LGTHSNFFGPTVNIPVLHAPLSDKI